MWIAMIVGLQRCIEVETGVRYVVDHEILKTDYGMLLFIRFPEGELEVVYFAAVVISMYVTVKF